MSDLATARRLPHAVLQPPAGAAVRFAPLPPLARFSLRARPAAQAYAAAPLGMALPATACHSATAGARSALWLGPDEWLLLLPEAEIATFPASLAQSIGALPYALVDISHRQSGFVLSGPEAVPVLNAVCALDLDPEAFPIGMCTRSVLAKADIVLWRTGAQSFHVEAWRSFLPYVWQVLAEAAREFG